ncbi:MAG: hypothetical protein Q8P01_00910 [bacterium]|nr:hypothetical protein [bacterium]
MADWRTNLRDIDWKLRGYSLRIFGTLVTIGSLIVYFFILKDDRILALFLLGLIMLGLSTIYLPIKNEKSKEKGKE